MATRKTCRQCAAIGVKVGRGFVVITNADSTAEVDVMQRDPFGRQRINQRQHPVGGIGQR